MISLRLMEDTMEDYTAMRNWFLEPELQEWVWHGSVKADGAVDTSKISVCERSFYQSRSRE